MPFPRLPFTLSKSSTILSNCSSKYAPTTFTLSKTFSFSYISRTVDNGLPPYVVPWSPGTKELQHFLPAINAPTGTPQPSPFAEAIISGTTS